MSQRARTYVFKQQPSFRCRYVNAEHTAPFCPKAHSRSDPIIIIITITIDAIGTSWINC